MNSNREAAHALLDALGLKNPEDWSCVLVADGWLHGERCLRAQAALDTREAETWEAAAALFERRAKDLQNDDWKMAAEAIRQAAREGAMGGKPGTDHAARIAAVEARFPASMTEPLCQCRHRRGSHVDGGPCGAEPRCRCAGFVSIRTADDLSLRTHDTGGTGGR